MAIKKIEWVDTASSPEAFIGIKILSGKVNDTEIFEINLDAEKSPNYRLYFINKTDLIFENLNISEVFEYADEFFNKWVKSLLIKK